MPKLVYDRWGIRVFYGDCLDVLRGLPDASVHSVVTDPPAGVGFMGRSWDSNRGGRTQWVEWLTDRMVEALRVLKPGGHALVWALPRTSHWTALALEDAGFEIRDCLTHIFGQGFAKSLDVSKAIDRRGGNPHLASRIGVEIRKARVSRKWTTGQADKYFCGGSTNWTWFEGRKGVCRPPTPDIFSRIVAEWPELEVVAEEVAEVERQVIGVRTTGIGTGHGSVTYISDSDNRDVTAPATDGARQWSGWGTALKPSSEHWWLVRKPLDGTVAGNVLEHGTGALNIDACRVVGGSTTRANSGHIGYHGINNPPPNVTGSTNGRWPSNTVFSHSALLDPVSGEVVGDACADGCVEGCPVAELDQQSGDRAAGGKKTGLDPSRYLSADDSGYRYRSREFPSYEDSGGASRFFHTFRWAAKATTAERPKVNGTAHPTVKSISLLKWMVRLVTPPGGVVLDCFAGTGTTGQAARAEGFKAVLIESDSESLPLIVARLDALPKSEAPCVGSSVVDAAPVDLFSLLGGVG